MRLRRLRNVNPGTTMWEMKVEVPVEKPTTLDLTVGNSAVSGDFDPPAAD